MLCVRSGSFAPHRNYVSGKRSSETCMHIRLQAGRIREMLRTENFTHIASASNGIVTTDNGCEESKCEVLQKLGKLYNCEVTFEKDGEKLKREMQGLINNLQMLRCSEEEHACNFSELSCSSEIENLSSWNKRNVFVDQVNEACLHIMQHVCPEVS